jgi:Glycosyl transferases group 1
MAIPTHEPRVLIFSQRNVFPRALFRCSLYEFENTIAEIDSAEILAPHGNVGSFRYNLVKRLGYHIPAAVSPEKNRTQVKDSYDLFLAICGAPTDLLTLRTVSNWRERCKTAVCLIDELWVTQMEGHRHFLSILKEFDIVMLYYSNSVEPLHELSGRKCVFLPPGVDAIRFCPYPHPPQRVIDVCSIGRRSETTHHKLLHAAEEKGIFYFYDTIAGDQAINSPEHRAFTANIAKRSRYFIVNPGLIDRPALRGNQIEIGNRYFEGCAAGAILLGERPANEAFGKLFDWPDSLIHLPYDSAEVNEIIREVDMQPERQENVRRTNVAQALLRHDWAYRWESILENLNLEPMPKLLKRKEHLRTMAELVAGSGFAAKHITTR